MALKAERVALNERVTAVRLNGNAARDTVELLSLCRPEHAGEYSELQVSPSQLRYNTHFLEEIKRELDTLTTSTQYDRTPLAETVYELSVRIEFTDAVAERRLILISDLIENTAQFSFIENEKLSFQDFRERRPNFSSSRSSRR